MELCVSAWCVQEDLFRRRMTVAEFIDLCALKGVESVELLDCFIQDDQHLKEIIRSLSRQSMKVAAFSIATDFVQDEPYSDVEIGKTIAGIETAHLLGARILRIFGGEEKIGIDHKRSHKLIVDSLRRCVEFAQRKGIILVLENHGTLCGRSQQIAQIIQEVSSVHLAANVDTGNFVLAGERPESAIRLLSSNIGFVHLKDLQQTNDSDGWSGVDGKMYVGSVIGRGDVDIGSVLRTLRKVEYSGYISLEFEGKGNQVQGTRESIDNARLLLSANMH